MKIQTYETRPIEILLVEDSPSDADLTTEAMREGKVANHLSVVEDGVQAMQFLRRQDQFAQAPRPDFDPARFESPAQRRARGVGGDKKGPEL